MCDTVIVTRNTQIEIGFTISVSLEQFIGNYAESRREGARKSGRPCRCAPRGIRGKLMENHAAWGKFG